jgi:hypothetical protein
MFHEVDDQLEAWARGVADGVTVSFGPPGELKAQTGVGLYLMELTEDPPARGSGVAPLRVALRYLVTTWGEPLEAHRVLGALVFEALADPDVTVDLRPLSPQAWTALGTVPRPAFILQRTVQRERAVSLAPPVTERLALRTGPLTTLHGVVLGPGDIPLASASVEVPHLGKRATTDGRGAFRLAGLPTSPPVTRLRVRARGHEQTVTAEQGYTGDAPVTIRIHFQGGDS